MNIVYAMTHHVYDWILPSLRSLAEHEPDANVYILAEHDELPSTGYTVSPAIVHFCGYHDWWTNPNIIRVNYLGKCREEYA